MPDTRACYACDEFFGIAPGEEMDECCPACRGARAPAARPAPSDSPGAIRARDGRWYLCNHRAKGWASYAFEYPTLAALLAAWPVRITGLASDEHGPHLLFAPASNLP